MYYFRPLKTHTKTTKKTTRVQSETDAYHIRSEICSNFATHLVVSLARNRRRRRRRRQICTTVGFPIARRGIVRISSDVRTRGGQNFCVVCGRCVDTLAGQSIATAHRLNAVQLCRLSGTRRGREIRARSTIAVQRECRRLMQFYSIVSRKRRLSSRQDREDGCFRCQP